MTWELRSQESLVGESVGDVSLSGFRGSRFTIKNDGLVLQDYNSNETYSNNTSHFENQIKQAMEYKQSGRIRIRGNGDTYCKHRNGDVIYVGNTDLGEDEQFDGFVLNPGYLHTPPFLFTGAHNHLQVGERWTIPQHEGWGNLVSVRTREEMNDYEYGKMGYKNKGKWSWATNKQEDFIRFMRSKYPHKGDEFFRFYITCYGLVIIPMDLRNASEEYDIDIYEEAEELGTLAPSSMRTIKERRRRVKAKNPLLSDKGIAAKTWIYFVVGHIDDIMGGEIPHPNTKSSRDFDEDKGQKWG